MAAPSPTQRLYSVPLHCIFPHRHSLTVTSESLSPLPTNPQQTLNPILSLSLSSLSSMAAAAPSTSPAAVQHVTKASSDQLLSKFAELGSEPPRSSFSSARKYSSQLIRAGPAIVRKNRRYSRRVAAGLGAREVIAAGGGGGDAHYRRRRRSSGGMAEWKGLLPPSSRRAGGAHSSLARKMGSRRPESGAPGIGSLLAALEKTWRRTLEGASKMFIDKHSNTLHARLASDIV